MIIHFRLRVGVLLSLIFLLAACGGPPRYQGYQGAIPSPKLSVYRQTAIVTAQSLIGVPYTWGGDSPEGFDCSGLTSYVYRRAGVILPRTANDQYQRLQSVSLYRLQPGDLVFFRIDSHKISHVGIYIGNSMFIHAPRKGERVTIASLRNSYWRRFFVGGGTLS